MKACLRETAQDHVAHFIIDVKMGLFHLKSATILSGRGQQPQPYCLACVKEHDAFSSTIPGCMKARKKRRSLSVAVD